MKRLLLIFSLVGCIAQAMQLPPINMQTLLNNPNINLGSFYGQDAWVQLDCLVFNYAKTSVINASRINSFDGIEKIMRRPSRSAVTGWNGPIYTTDSWRGKFFLHTRDYCVESLNFDNQAFTQITGEDITHLKTIFPNLKRISLKNNQITRVAGAFNVRHLTINLQGNPLQSIEIETPEKCNYLEFITDGNIPVPVQFRQNIYSKTKTWFKALVAKSKTITYGLLPSKAGVFAGALVLGIYALVKSKTGPIYENVERAGIIEGVKDKLVQIVPQNIQEQVAVSNIGTALEVLNLPVIIREEPGLLKSILSRSADGMLIGAGLLTAIHTAGEIGDALDNAAHHNPYRIRVQNINNLPFNNTEMASGHTYRLFGRF